MEKQCWRILRKLKTELLYDPAIPLLGIYLYKTRIQRDICTPVFIAALFIIARAWKQPTCPSTDEWKVWYVLSHFSLFQLFATSSVHGIFQAGILEWVTVPSSKNVAHEYNGTLHALHGQSCPTLCDPMDCSSPGSSVRGTTPARIVEWVAISSSWDLPNSGSKPAFPVVPVLAGRFFTTEPSGKPTMEYYSAI